MDFYQAIQWIIKAILIVAIIGIAYFSVVRVWTSRIDIIACLKRPSEVIPVESQSPKESTKKNKTAEEASTVLTLILRNKETVNVYDFMFRLLKIGSTHKNGYVLLNTVNTFFTKKDKIITNSEIIALDLMEMTFWTWLSKRYYLHWDVEINKDEGISGGGYTISIVNDAEKTPLKLEFKDIQEYLKDNIYHVDKGNIWGITLPSGSSVAVQRNGSYSRIINIKNQYIDFGIKIYHPGNSGLGFTVLGENIKKTLQSPETWFVENFKINFDCKYTIPDNEILQFEKQKKWVDEIMKDFYNDFEWTLIKPDLEKAYTMSVNSS